jgi:putative spermidine/putrescine transport system ATP-binding protein
MKKTTNLTSTKPNPRMPGSPTDTGAGGGLQLRGITLTRPGTTHPVLHALDLQVAEGELCALLGPSGCGKTTTVHITAGLLAPDRGTVHLHGSDVTRTAPEGRATAVVFQQPLLLPHLSALDNVAFPARMRGHSRRKARAHARSHLEQLAISHLAGHYPRQLSGGQAQRVALARALAAAPRALLLDEPFSALDPTLRAEMRDLLRQIQRELGITTLLVTHDQMEAAALADTIAVLHDGRILQQARPDELYARPTTLTVARFLGCPTALPGTVTPTGTFRCALGDLDLPPHARRPGPGHLVIRPEAVTVADGPHAVPALVHTLRREGALTALTAHTAAGPLHALLPPGPLPAEGERIWLTLPVEHRWIIPDIPGSPTHRTPAF